MMLAGVFDGGVLTGALLLALGVGARVAYALLNLPYNAPDEAAHWNYSRYVRAHKKPPDYCTQTEGSAYWWENHQPVDYYWLVAVFTQLRGARLLSVGIFLCSALLVWHACIALGAGLLPLALFCLLPAFVTLSASVNNDNLLILWGTVWSHAVMVQFHEYEVVAWIAAVLAARAKLTGLVLVPLSIFLLPIGVWPLCLVVSVWWLAPTVRRSYTLMQSSLVRWEWQSVYAMIIGPLQGFLHTLCMAAGKRNGYRDELLLGNFVVVAVIVGAVQEPHIYTIVGLVMLTGQSLLSGLLHNQAQGRFIFPLLLPFCVYAVEGWMTLWSR